MVESPYFACSGLDDDIAQRDLSVAAESDGAAAASRENGGAVVSVHGDAESWRSRELFRRALLAVKSF